MEGGTIVKKGILLSLFIVLSTAHIKTVDKIDFIVPAIGFLTGYARKYCQGQGQNNTANDKKLSYSTLVSNSLIWTHIGVMLKKGTFISGEMSLSEARKVEWANAKELFKAMATYSVGLGIGYAVQKYI